MVEECIILAESPAALVELHGISVLERLLRTLQRCGFQRATVLSTTADVIAREVASSPSWAHEQIEVTVRSREPGSVTVEQIVDVWPPRAQSLLVLRGDTVFDARLLRILAAQKQSAVLIDRAPAPVLVELVASAPEMAGAKFCGAAVVDHDWAAARRGSFEENLRRDLATEHIAAIDVAAEPSYSREMRRDVRPFWFPAPAPAEKKLAERLLLRSAQKGTQDLPAWIHAPIENFLISKLSKTSVTPNQLTFFCNVVAWTATILFATGRLGWGLIIALTVGVLDGLDGKQARLKVETTKSGKLEHWFDALFEWSWWITLAYHFQKTGQLTAAFSYLFLLIWAEAVAGLAKWSVVRFCGRSIDELGDFTRAVRLVGGRRNIYIWIFALGILLGTPGQAFMLMAWWGAITAAVQVPCAAFALWVRRK